MSAQDESRPKTETTETTPEKLPLFKHQFRVRFADMALDDIVKVSVLARKVDVAEHVVGAQSPYSIKDPKQHHLEPLVIERRLSNDALFEELSRKVWTVPDFRFEISIELLSGSGNPVVTFVLKRSWVSGYEAFTELSTELDEIATERITVQYEELIRR